MAGTHSPGHLPLWSPPTMTSKPVGRESASRRIVQAMNGYPCSSPGCEDAATWAVLSEVAREGDPTEWGVWNYSGSLPATGTSRGPRTRR
jgi:hypothetical protein